jgi:hypothetical protein
MTLRLEDRSAWGFSHKTAGGARLALESGEVHRLNPIPSGIRILSGIAWLTWKGEDIVLSKGQALAFTHNGNHPVISSVGKNTLVIEMLQPKET